MKTCGIILSSIALIDYARLPFSSSLRARRRIPVFGNFAVLNSEHIEPCGLVWLSLGVFVFLNKGQHNQVALRHDRDHVSFDLRLDLKRSSQSGEVGLETRDAGIGIRIVLNV